MKVPTERVDRCPSPGLLPARSVDDYGIVQFNPDTLAVAVTGHRPNKFRGGYDWFGEVPIAVRSRLMAELKRLCPRFCISGMALGVDQWFAAVSQGLGIPTVAAVPCDGQDRLWPAESQTLYRELLAHCSAVYTVRPGEYAAWKMLERDKWMVDRCNVLIAVWNGDTSGGTYHTYQYAGSIGKSIIRINPREL